MQGPGPRVFDRCLMAALAMLVLSGPVSGGKGGPNDLASYDALIKPSDRKHWAFQPVCRPEIPSVRNAAWVRNPIDAFILAKLEARNWKPSSPAEPRALLRRLYLDVSGLPPTLAEQEAILKNPSAEAFDRTVQELLSRASYGERWARHWLDLVRYADTNGYERDETKPNVWRYRDYVIRALNHDKPFDRFLLEQLAGDELPDADAETLVASGYCRLGPWDDEPADPKEDRFDQLDDIVSTTSLAFQGLSLGCARCHNHKFDPLTQLDYYRMVAIFDPLQRPRNGRTELDRPAAPRKQVEAWTRKEIAIGLTGFVVPSSPLGPASFSAMSAVSVDLAAQARDASAAFPRGYFLEEPSARPPATHLLIRGKASRPGPEVAPGMPAVLVETQPAFPAPGAVTSLRRLTLARWMVSPQNPLTARVIVNRVWQFHFGEGLVRTASDFGVMGERPTHPELLDWLADWLVRQGWSLKKLHRLILTSNTYRMSKTWNPEYGAEDPEDRLLWRVPYRRLEVEALRDSMLAVSGRLNPKMYGPSMYPEVPKEALASHSDPDKIWKPFNEREASRRTIYAFIKRSMVVPMLEVLDLCDTTRSSAKRSVTTVAPQSLSLFNGSFVNRQARHLAQRLQREVGDDTAKQVEHAYLLVLCRPPTATEREAMIQYLRKETESLNQQAGPGQPAERPATALHQACRVLFNLNEFAYTD
jgi:hypothetical protein